jgi:uncharacterized damage-inducible protein DinB
MSIIDDLKAEFIKHQRYIDGAVAALGDEQFFHVPGPGLNSIALIIKHMGGNLKSRWTDFLTADGEKPTRHRDGEFVRLETDTRTTILGAFTDGLACLYGTLDQLTDADLVRTITIRGEAMTAQVALIRALGHFTYHTGQILYLKRLLAPGSAWLTMPLKTS